MKFSRSVLRTVQLDLVICIVTSILNCFCCKRGETCEAIKKKDTKFKRVIYWKFYEELLHTCVGKLFI